MSNEIIEAAEALSEAWALLFNRASILEADVADFALRQEPDSLHGDAA